MKKFQLSFIAAAALLLTSAPVMSATIGYWRLEDAGAGTPATTLVSEVNSPSMNGTEDAATPDQVHSSDVPGPSIFDPVAGTTVPNNTSLYSQEQHSQNARFDVTNPPQPAAFTFEIFVKAPPTSVSPFDVIAGQARSNGEYSWSLWDNNSGNLYLRMDLQAVAGSGDPGTNTNINVGNPAYNTQGNSGFIHDLNWHHIAVTYDPTGDANGKPEWNIYNDYRVVGTFNEATATAGGQFDPSLTAIVYEPGMPLTIGGRLSGNSYNGWIDEPRFSDTVLSPSEFLRIPEPAPVALLLLGITAVLALSRRTDLVLLPEKI